MLASSAARGLANVDWPGRLQRLLPESALARHAAPAGPVWIDGAHNPAAAEVLAAELATWPAPPILIAGMLRNKDYRQMLTILAPHVDRLIAVPVPRSSAGLEPGALAAAAQELGLRATAASDLPEAMRQAASTGLAHPVVIAGSLYLAGAALQLAPV